MTKSPLYVVQLCPGDFPSKHGGGVEAYVNDLSNGLLSLGLKVTVIAHGGLNRETGIEKFQLITVNSHQMRNFFGRPTIAQTINESFFAIKAISCLPKNYDIIHVYSLFSAINASKRMRAGSKLVYTTHDPSWLNSLSNISSDLNWGIQRQVMKRASAVTAFNKSMKEALVNIARLSPDKIFVVPPCRNTDFFASEMSSNYILKKLGLDGKRVILFVGVVVPRKGVTVLIKAFENLVKKGGIKDVKLLIVGSFSPWGSEKPSDYALGLMDYCQRNDLSKNVLFTGAVELEELKQLYSAASLFVLPSFSDAMPGVIIEAMSSGKPVVGSRISGIIDLIREGENGYTFKTGDHENLSLVINHILSDDALLQRLGRNSRRIAIEEYSRDAVARQMKSVYEAIS